MHVVTTDKENWLLHYNDDMENAGHTVGSFVPELGARGGAAAGGDGYRGPRREAFLTYVAPVHYNVLEPRAAADAKPKADDANAETDSDATREADDAKADDAKPKADGVKAEANSDARTERPPVPGLGVPRW